MRNTQDLKNFDFSKYAEPVEDDSAPSQQHKWTKEDLKNFDFSKYAEPVEGDPYGTFMHFRGYPEAIKDAGQSLKRMAGGAVEGTVDIGRALQKGLLGLGGLISGQDLSKYATPEHHYLSPEDENTIEAQIGKNAPYLIPYGGAAALAEDLIPKATKLAPRIGRSLATSILGGGVPSAILNPDDKAYSAILGSAIPFGGALAAKLVGGTGRIIGKGLQKALPDKVANYFKDLNLNDVKRYVQGGFHPTSYSARLLRDAYGSPGSDIEGLASKLGKEYQKHALASGKHIIDNGVARGLINTTYGREENPVYSSLERKIKNIESRHPFVLRTDIYNKAIDDAIAEMSQSGRGSIPLKYIDKEGMASSPLEAYKRYREINRNIFHGQNVSPDVLKGASILKKGISDMFDRAAYDLSGIHDEPYINRWSDSFKKSDNSLKNIAKNGEYLPSPNSLKNIAKNEEYLPSPYGEDNTTRELSKDRFIDTNADNKEKYNAGKNIKEWLSSFKKANNSFMNTVQLEKLLPGIENTSGGIAPDRVVHNFLDKISSGKIPLSKAEKQFGSPLTQDIKNALLHKEIGGNSNLYNPPDVLNVYDNLNNEVKNKLFDENQRAVLDKMSNARKEYGRIPSRDDLEKTREGAHIGGFVSEMAHHPYGIGSSVPWLKRILTGMSGRQSFKAGKEASPEEVREMLGRVGGYIDRNHSSVDFSPELYKFMKSYLQTVSEPNKRSE